MKEVKLKNWEEFEEQIRELIAENKEIQSKTNDYHSELLFRGQADSKWKLKTSLERFTSEKYSIESYNELIRSIKNNIESFTNASFKLKLFIIL